MAVPLRHAAEGRVCFRQHRGSHRNGLRAIEIDIRQPAGRRAELHSDALRLLAEKAIDLASGDDAAMPVVADWPLLPKRDWLGVPAARDVAKCNGLRRARLRPAFPRLEQRSVGDALSSGDRVIL